MLFFDFILILLAAVLLSNLINRFLPAFSVPIVQILLGVLIALLPFGPFGLEFEFEPELFFVLFIAPLVFFYSKMANKKTLWQMKKPILGAAVGLVFVTAIAVGGFLYLLVPTIPLAAAFAFAAALGPTDIVAVEAVAKRVPLPKKIMAILSGESIINDAMGLVCFQFAVAAVMTGSFSLAQGLLQFLGMGIGGLLAGLILTWLTHRLVKWLQSLGIENATLHILIDVLTPFIIFMIAENLHVSGILAVFVAGIAHSSQRDNLNPETIRLHIAQESVWSVLAFTFDGLVFVMLGTQFPNILKTISSGAYSIGGWQIAGCVLLIMLALAIIRFIWWSVTVSRKTYDSPEHPIGRIKSGVIFSLAGARGGVPLAGVLSIPLFLLDGSAFPERDLIILIASGVIVVSLVITNFILPFFADSKSGKTELEGEPAARSQILHMVIDRLKSAATPETFAATKVVIRSYYSRMHQRPSEFRKEYETESERRLRRNILLWEKENTLRLAETGQISETVAKRFVAVLDTRIQGRRHNPLRLLAWAASHAADNIRQMIMGTHDQDLMELTAANVQFVLDKLDELKLKDNSPVVKEVAAEYAFAASMRQNRGRGMLAASNEIVLTVAIEGFQIERDMIQQMFEAGCVSWETANTMRKNIAALEARLYMD